MMRNPESPVCDCSFPTGGRLADIERGPGIHGRPNAVVRPFDRQRAKTRRVRRDAPALRPTIRLAPRPLRISARVTRTIASPRGPIAR